MADFLLDIAEPLLPRPLLVAILSGRLVRILLPGMASFSFFICFSTRAEVLLFLGNRVLVFSGLSCLLGASYFPGELFQLFQQVLVSDAKRLTPPRPCWLAQSLTCLREVGYPRRLVGLPSSEDWRYSYLCSEFIPSVAERSALFVKELSFPQTAPN